MSFLMRYLIILPLLLGGCASVSEKDTLASLKNVKLEIKEEKIKGSLDKAMESYRKFLEQTPESAMTPEAIRRLADLKVEKEYGVLEDSDVVKNVTPQENKPMPAPVKTAETGVTATSPTAAKNKSADSKVAPEAKVNPIADLSESQKEFEKRATEKQEFRRQESSPT